MKEIKLEWPTQLVTQFILKRKKLNKNDPCRPSITSHKKFHVQPPQLKIGSFLQIAKFTQYHSDSFQLPTTRQNFPIKKHILSSLKKKKKMWTYKI